MTTPSYRGDAHLNCGNSGKKKGVRNPTTRMIKIYNLSIRILGREKGPFYTDSAMFQRKKDEQAGQDSFVSQGLEKKGPSAANGCGGVRKGLPEN